MSSLVRYEDVQLVDGRLESTMYDPVSECQIAQMFGQ
jgi:hypothetical protein